MTVQRPPSRAQKHWQAGLAHGQARRWPAAAAEFERAAALAPGDSGVWLNLARARKNSFRIDDAVVAAQRAFDLDTSSVVACRLLAECLTCQHRYKDAVACFERLAPDAARDDEFFSAHGIALFSAGRPRDAIDVFFLSLAQKIDAPLVHYRLGLTFMDLDMKEEASECFRTAVALDDGSIRAMALALLVHESAQACQWGQLADETAALRAAMHALRPADGNLLSPFAFISIDCLPSEQRQVGMLRAQALGNTVPRLPPLPKHRAPGRIRIGYLSNDFYNHATALLMAELLEQRDTAVFEVVLYSHSPIDRSALQRRVMAACDRFVDVTSLDNVRLSERIRADGIDILVDLKGHTRGGRFEVLAARPAPVQAAYLGYPGTTGADYIDYVVGDPIVTPLADEDDFSEKIAQLPWSYQPNDRQRELRPSPGRAACGLPDDAVVLCCFNQVYKVTPDAFDAWARILQRVPNAVLWMLAWNPQAQNNLRIELQRRGIDPSRLHFAAKASMQDHVARLQCADLFLDTWPCNAHTTASESLWAGVPVLTHRGTTFASRVAASLARATHTGELICDTVDDYVDLAVALATDLPRLHALQRHLREQRMSLPLFDSEASTRALEALYVRMFERQQAGLPPDHLPAA